MAQAKRFKNYLLYIFAILISGFFSLLGKASPSWAQEAKRDHYSQIFRSSFAADDGDKNNFIVAQTSGSEKDISYFKAGRINPQFINDNFNINYFKAGTVNPRTFNDTVNKGIDKALDEIVQKVNRGEELSHEDLALVQSLQNAEALNQMRSDLKILTSVPEQK